MGRPLRVLNTSDLAEMSDDEIKGRIVPLILDKFAQAAASSLRGNVHWHSGHNPTGGIGNGSNTIRTNDVGYHGSSPTALSTYNFSFSLRSDAESSSPTWPVGWEGSGVIGEMNTTKLKTDILRCCAEVWKQTGTSTGVGSYYIGTGIPNLGGTWKSATTMDSDGYSYGAGSGTILSGHTQTHRLSGTDGSSTYHLFRKTADSGSADSTLSSGNGYIPCTSMSGGSIRQMTDAEVEGLVNEWRNYLLTDQGGSIGTIGSYQLTTSSSAPAGGTWTQMGTFADALANVQSQNYSNNYTRHENMYTVNYTHTYGHYQGTHRYHNMYTQNFNRYTTMYTQQYAGDTVMNTQSTTTYYLWRRIG